MKANTLFVTTAMVALATAGTFADTLSSPPLNSITTLWNQNSNFGGGGIISDYCTSGTSACSAAADDFVVPAGKAWTVKEVDVTGVFYDGSGPAASANITFYTSAKGLPGKVVRTFSNQDCGGGPDFACLIRGIKLTGGTKGTTYWVSVVANCSFIDGCGEWGWVTNTTIHHHQAVWKGNGCTGWCQIGSDLAFDLKGKRS